MSNSAPAGQGTDREKLEGQPSIETEPGGSSSAAAGATVDDFVDTLGPGAMRNDYKDLTGAATQTPELARELWSRINGQEFPYEFDPEMLNFYYSWEVTVGLSIQRQVRLCLASAYCSSRYTRPSR